MLFSREDKWLHTFPKRVCPKVHDWNSNSLIMIPQTIDLTNTPRGHPQTEIKYMKMRMRVHDKSLSL